MAVFFRYLTLSSVVRPRVGMQGQAVKVILAFGERFWPEDMLLTFCAESVASQVWADPPRQSIHDGFHTLTGFITGSQATAASAWPTWRTVDAVLKQLDSMFSASSDRTPASRCYTDHIICDWVKFPNICSSYSSPSGGNPLAAAFAQTYHGGAISIVGEHVQGHDHYEIGTINGAMESAKLAASSILRMLTTSPKL